MDAHTISREELEDRLKRASAVAVDTASKLVRQVLPESWLYLIEPNCSYDGNPLDDDEEVFSEDSLPPGERLGPLSVADAASWLWRGGKIPEWVDVRVYNADRDHAYFLLTCCGRFTGLWIRLYHLQEGYQPFHVTSPVEPPGWESVDKHGRFDLEGQPRRAG